MVLSFVLIAALLSAQPADRVADIQVQGNSLTPDAEVIRLAAVEIGMPAAPGLVDEVALRLRQSRKFKHVDVLRRFASIADPTQILIVIVVDEGRVQVKRDSDSTAHVERRRGPGFMYLPLFNREDGYGFTYGVETAIPRPIGPGSRLSFPATWGGERRAGVKLEQDLAGMFSRAIVFADVTRRVNPHYEESDLRLRVQARGERTLTKSLRLGVTGAWQHVTFQDQDDRFTTIGADLTFDTRIDPLLSRNAIFARAAVDVVAPRSAETALRTDLDARAYVGLLGQSVVIVRGLRQDSTSPLPPYLSPLFGGLANVRGFEPGVATGDTLVAASAEFRLPLTSPLSIGKLGVSAFVDTGAIYAKTERLADVDLQRSYGGGVWLSAALFRADVYVAHVQQGTPAYLRDQRTRVHFVTTLLF